ncbi:B-4DMT family transporter [Mycobacterium sp. PS03-16]|uniref:B-4DMT family transporter n=1 Tax=Mycobacterium sp. PS03-16 TaxID=2559611 RepID=UPI00143091B5|nr:B-4DMT family transporter [Mycobacterium sp. PS03-16]
MSKWLLRGLVFAALMVIVRLLQGAMINAWETRATTISIVLVSVYAVLAFLWGFIDGRTDARRNPDPDRRSDLAMTWLLAGLFAGVVSGLVAWFIGMFYKNLYVEGLLNEITTFAAFTALLTFLLAMIGVALGRWLVDRKSPDAPRQREGDDDRADTDVFAAVRAGGPEQGTHDAQQTSPVAGQGGGTDRATPPENRL